MLFMFEMSIYPFNVIYILKYWKYQILLFLESLIFLKFKKMTPFDVCIFFVYHIRVIFQKSKTN